MLVCILAELIDDGLKPVENSVDCPLWVDTSCGVNEIEFNVLVKTVEKVTNDADKLIIVPGVKELIVPVPSKVEETVGNKLVETNVDPELIIFVLIGWPLWVTLDGLVLSNETVLVIPANVDPVTNDAGWVVSLER